MKYRETEGIKDATGYTRSGYKASTFEQFSDWANRGNYDKAVVVSDLSVVSKPANPTRVYTSRIRNTGSTPISITLNPGESSSAAYSLVSTVYDCTTWADYYTLNGQAYWGYNESTRDTVIANTETKTFLAQGGSTAVQNFAFDGMEDID